jgi:hypothetical protein
MSARTRSLATLFKVTCNITASNSLNYNWSKYREFKEQELPPLKESEYGYHGEAFFASKPHAWDFIDYLVNKRRQIIRDIDDQICQNWEYPERPACQLVRHSNQVQWTVVQPPTSWLGEIEPWVVPIISLVKDQAEGKNLKGQFDIFSNYNSQRMALGGAERIRLNLHAKPIDYVTKPTLFKISDKERLAYLLTVMGGNLHGDVCEYDESETDDDPDILKQYFQILHGQLPTYKEKGNE